MLLGRARKALEELVEILEPGPSVDDLRAELEARRSPKVVDLAEA